MATATSRLGRRVRRELPMSDVSSAARLEADRSSLLVVKAGTLVDGTGAAPRRGVQIYVRNGQIADVTTSGDVPSDAQVLDFSGQAVVPGLIDCHVHLAFSAGVDPLADL